MFSPVTIDEAIEIHAKIAIFRGGSTAEPKTRERALICQARGDHDGHRTWTKVADRIRALGAEEKPLRRRTG